MSYPFPFTILDYFGPVQASIAAYRTSMGLPQLTGPDGIGTGTIAIGPEYLDFQLAPPMLIIVPTDERVTNYIDSGVSDSGQPVFPKRYYTTEMGFEAWCWGDEDPNFASTGNTSYSFDSALEIRRELSVALAQLGGIPEVQLGRGRWHQPSNEKRLGRMYVLEFSLWSPINDLGIGPLEVLPFATATSSGVQVDTIITITSPDGSSTIQMGTIIAPPP